MMNISQFHADQPMLHMIDTYGQFSGIYFLSSLVVKFDRYGRPYAGIKLSDMLTSVHVNCFLPHALTMLKEPNVPVRVSVSISKIDGVVYYRCDSIDLVNFNEFANEVGIYGLPLSIYWIFKEFMNGSIR